MVHKEDVRSHTLKDGRVIKIHMQDSSTFVARHGNKRVGALIVDYPDKDGNRNVFNTEVHSDWRKLGVGTHLYDRAEEKFGRLVPSTAQTDDAVAFWQKRRPDAYSKDDLRFRADAGPSLIGKKITHPEYGEATITKVLPNGASVTKDNGNTFWVGRKLLKDHGHIDESRLIPSFKVFLLETSHSPRTTEHTMKDGTPFKVVNTDSHTYFAMHNDIPVAKAQVAKDGNYIHAVDVSPDMQKRGIASEMYRRIEQDHGELQPSKSQSPRGFALWKSFRPSALDPTDLRLKEKELVGKTVSHPDFGTGTIHGVGRYNAIVAKGLDTFTVPRKHLIAQGLLNEAELLT